MLLLQSFMYQCIRLVTPRLLLLFPDYSLAEAATEYFRASLTPDSSKKYPDLLPLLVRPRQSTPTIATKLPGLTKRRYLWPANHPASPRATTPDPQEPRPSYPAKVPRLTASSPDLKPLRLNPPYAAKPDLNPRGFFFLYVTTLRCMK